MTAQLLANELANLVQESKRRNNDLRQAAEKSLEDLRSIGPLSEQALPAELSRRVNFVNPFIIACGTKNAKFTGIAIVCLQRLIVAKALPKNRLNQVLEALMQASSAGLDVQLKILQALPSLLQNYASELRGELLVAALNICFTLQSSKNAIVSNTSAATLQQLVASVFDKVISEDKENANGPVAGEAPSKDGKVGLRDAALDAYRIFNDLCLLTENQRPEFLRFTGLSQTFGLELIESVITNHATVIATHPEQAHILRVRVMPLIMSALKGKPSYATTIRLVRILYTMLRRHISTLPSECSDALDILTRLLDQETAVWKKALCMEVFRGIFAEHVLVRRIYALYDAQPGQRDVIKALTANFVRLSTEKPAVIGLGPHSSMPATTTVNNTTQAQDQVVLEASSVTGIISTPVGTESAHIGISSQWSSMRVPCIDQLDKTEPPSIPESYTYSLILSCLSSLSDGLAKFILPLTVPGEGRSRRKGPRSETGRDSPAPTHPEADEQSQRAGLERSASFRKNPVPLNPLALSDHPLKTDIKTCAAIVDVCWPAILATCSTFLYSALDSEYYHGLVRAFQRFAHVAGLLRLSTPRDAFLTTLGKAAVPPNVLTACLNTGPARPPTPSASVEAPNSIFSNARGLLSVESLSPSSAAVERRQASFDGSTASLNTRNLLCLRALLNLGIALGPTLSGAWSIVLKTLQQADFVLHTTGKTPGRATSLKPQDIPSDADKSSLMANFSVEVRSVETAASRLIESTVDFPNESFIEVVQAICGLLHRVPEAKQDAGAPKPSLSANPPVSHTSTAPHRRVPSFSGPISIGSNQEDQFALVKLGDIAAVNIERLLAYPAHTSGWAPLVDELISTLDSHISSSTVRIRATEILCRFMLDAAQTAAPIHVEARGVIQVRILKSLRDAQAPFRTDHGKGSISNQATNTDIHKLLLDGLKNIIENCGESLVSGWEVAFEIMGGIFVTKDFDKQDRRGSLANPILLAARSPKLIRPAFNSLQLICSDFLASLPNSCFLILVDTLYKFSSQDDDLNIALTTVTFFWVLSDFLSGKNESLEITADLMQRSTWADLEAMASDPDRKGSDAALWMLLLLRLTNVASDDRFELRNSAVQTLLRIFDAYGERLTPEAWSICVKYIVFKLLSSLREELKVVEVDNVAENDQAEWNGTAVVILDGISTLLANYLDVLTDHPSFNHLWRELLEHFASLLDFQVLDINTATFRALGHVLSRTGEDGKPAFADKTIDFAWDLWSRGIPISKTADGQSQDNQKCLIAYVAAFREVYRLVQQDLTVDKVRTMLGLLRNTVEEASPSGYSSDIDHMTQLQTQVLDAIRMVRADVSKVPSALIAQVADFVALPFGKTRSDKVDSKRTNIAMSKASMKMLEELIIKHAEDKDIFQSGAFSAALSALKKPIALKYDFPVATKTVPPWRMATSTTLIILRATLSRLHSSDTDLLTVQGVWAIIASIAHGILAANCDTATANANVADDETFDIDSFHELRKLIIPLLGVKDVSERTRKAYAESLFNNSIVHAPTPADEALISSRDESRLPVLLKPRAGRTSFVPAATRTRMSYVAYEHLFLLVSTDHGRIGGASVGDADAYGRIARATAPWLIFRCALTLRSYAADQPLRGKMPQPLSQRKELRWVLRQLVDLRSQREGISETGGVESETRQHLIRLYPLLVGALGVGGDEKVQKLVREALEVVGGTLAA